jgi:hypothetical protein
MASLVVKNLRDDGAVTPASTATAIRQALNTLIDLSVTDSATGASNTDKIIFIPGSPSAWQVDRPVWVGKSRVKIYGEGRENTHLNSTGGYPALFFMTKTPGGATLDPATNFLDAFGVLDASAASATGQRWGLATKGSSFLISSASALSHGPYQGGWPSLSGLTVDFAIDLGPYGLSKTRTNQTLNSGYPLFGLSHFANPSPFLCRVDPNYGIQVYFCTIDSAGTRTIRSFTFNTTAINLVRVAWQIDFVNRRVLAIVNGLIVAVNSAYLGADWATATGLTFIDNELSHFCIASESNGLAASAYYGGASAPMTTVGGYSDLRLYGLHVNAGPRYNNGTVGATATRIDAGSTNDANTYFALATPTIAYLTCSENPTDIAPDRFVRIRAGVGAVGTMGHPEQWAAYLSAQHNDIAVGISDNEIKDISLQCGVGYGHAVALGWVLNFRAERVEVRGGAYGLATLNCGANYPVWLYDVRAYGYDSPIYLFWSIFTIDKLNVQLSGRTSIRLAGATGTIKDSFVAANGSPAHLIKIHGHQAGGFYQLNNFTWDFEGGPYPSGAVIYCEAHGFVPSTKLGIDGLGGGTIGGGAVVIDLLDGDHAIIGNDPPKATLSLRNFAPGLRGDSNHPAIIRAESPWQGELVIEDTDYAGSGGLIPWLLNNPRSDTPGPHGIVTRQFGNAPSGGWVGQGSSPSGTTGHGGGIRTGGGL